MSYVDKTSEKHIVERLHELLPEAGFIAEEGSGSLEEQEYCWVVDPLDGTSNYIPVSYTHLDVYKRQVQDSCAWTPARDT